jgi:hypothetical protein
MFIITIKMYEYNYILIALVQYKLITFEIGAFVLR